jgi:hypothetical protein
MKLFFGAATFVALAIPAFALPTSGDFVASECGYAAYKTGKIQICTGTVSGAQISNPSTLRTYLQIGNNVYAAISPAEAAGNSPTQPLDDETKVRHLTMKGISDGQSIQVTIKTFGTHTVAVEATLPSGVILSASGFDSYGGAQ